MRAFRYSLIMITPLFVSMTTFGQEQKTLTVFSEKPEKVVTEKSLVAVKPANTSRKRIPRIADQRMTTSQRLIHQRALEQARQRVYRINKRKAMGRSLSRPNVSNNYFRSNVDIIQPAPNLFYNPHRFFYGYGYGP